MCRTLVCSPDEASGAGRDLLTEDRRAALALFQAAVTRDPGSAQRWCDLGDALMMNGDVAGGSYCFARAYELLSKDEWFAKEETERLGRMKRMGGLA